MLSQGRYLSMEKFKINDRVRRTNFRTAVKISKESNEATAVIDTTPLPRGCLGTVKALREETTMSAKDSKEKTVMVHVLWDNGTLSYLGPEGLEVIKG